jgi:hypothetical protein
LGSPTAYTGAYLSLALKTEERKKMKGKRTSKEERVS